jgi:hypothetical protein
MNALIKIGLNKLFTILSEHNNFMMRTFQLKIWPVCFINNNKKIWSLKHEI